MSKRSSTVLLSFAASGSLGAGCSLPRSHIHTTTTPLDVSGRLCALPSFHLAVQKNRSRSHFSGRVDTERIPQGHNSSYNLSAHHNADFQTGVNIRRIPASRASHQTIRPIELNPLEDILKTLFLDVAKYIRDKKFKERSQASDLPELELRFVGGWVRDKLLGMDSNDVDLAVTDMSSYDFANAIKEYMDIPENMKKYEGMGVRQLGPASVHRIRANARSLGHGGIYVANIFGRYIDIFTLRNMRYVHISKSELSLGSAKEDAFRRDATINALFYNLRKSKVEDFTGQGIEDLKNQMIRTPSDPHQTLRADPVRILRLIRFATRRGYRIHEDLMKAMHNRQIAEALRDKSRTRYVALELDKILKGPNPRKALYFIDRLGLYRIMFTTEFNGFLPDISTWQAAYDSVARLMNPWTQDDKNLQAASRYVSSVLIRSPMDAYYAWMIALLAPWIALSGDPTMESYRRLPERQPHPPWAVEVAKDCLCPTLGNLVVLSEVSTRFRRVIHAKPSLLNSRMGSTADEICEQVRLHVESWGPNWRVCVIMAILYEAMTRNNDFSRIIQEYDRFLKIHAMNEPAR